MVIDKMKKTSDKTASKTEDGLNFQQEEFCQLYVNADRELFGNGTRCYIEAYDVDLTRKGAYDVARVKACQLLTKGYIIARINELLETGGFNNENVDKQHLFLINQHADLKTKMAAIKEYNELKQRISKKLDITSGGEKIVFVPPELLEKHGLASSPKSNSEEQSEI